MIDPDITRLSPYSTAGQPKGQVVIIHATRSGTSMNPSEYEGTLNYFANNALGVSAHWVIGRDGQTARVVADDRRSHHAGEHNEDAWGIELEQGVEDDGFTEPQIRALVEVAAGYVEDYGVAPRRTDGGDSGFIGHEDTAQGQRIGKSDPGRLFAWDTFIKLLEAAVAADTNEKHDFDRTQGLDSLSHFIAAYSWETYGNQEKGWRGLSRTDLQRVMAIVAAAAKAKQ